MEKKKKKARGTPQRAGKRSKKCEAAWFRSQARKEKHRKRCNVPSGWTCCSCDPLLLPDPILEGFTIGEVVDMKDTRNGQKRSK